jgi:beta-glucosidase
VLEFQNKVAIGLVSLSDLNLDFASVIIANFGASDQAILDVVFGKASPQGKLPIELPSSMKAVRNQKEDLPYDSKDPLYHFGFGLTY